jgi:hypothetical protein
VLVALAVARTCLVLYFGRSYFRNSSEHFYRGKDYSFENLSRI